jgi:GNAT superfamily N-acetyltransferase
MTSFTLDSVLWDDPRAVELRRLMDLEMTARYTDPDAEPEPAEWVARRTAALAVHPEDVRATVLVLDADGTPLAHAVLRELRGDWEVKRVIVTAASRGRGIGRALMAHLEVLARAGGAPRLILQTGNRQPDAVALYEKVGYTPIPIYEPYVETIPFSLCYEKVLSAA